MQDDTNIEHWFKCIFCCKLDVAECKKAFLLYLKTTSLLQKKNLNSCVDIERICVPYLLDVVLCGRNIVVALHFCSSTKVIKVNPFSD